MDSFAQMLQQTAFARWVAESGSLLGYPTILFLHTLGLATIAGLSAAISLRMLGVARGIPIAPLVRFYPTMWIALAVTVLSGVALLVADATTKLGQTVFYAKMVFVVLAAVALQMLRTRVLRDPMVDTRPLPANAKVLAATSLVLWIAATTAGRLMAYIY